MSSTLMPYALLGLAIVAEVIGTAFLQESDQFTRPLPTILMVAFYAGSFYFLSLTLRTMPLGIAYALWAGLGIILTTTLGAAVFHQRIDAPALLGIGLVVSGVVVMQLFSESLSY